MALSYWNNLWKGRDKPRVFAANTLVYGHTTKVVLKLENAQRFRAGAKLGNTGSRVRLLQDYVSKHNIKTRVESRYLGLFQDEEILKQFFVDMPEYIEFINKVVVPTCDEARDLLNEGFILSPYKTHFTKRATIKAGRYKDNVIERIITLANGSNGKLKVSEVFDTKYHKVFMKQVADPYISSGFIYTNDEKYFTLLSLLDEKLVHKIQSFKSDPSAIEKKRKVKGTKEKAA